MSLKINEIDFGDYNHNKSLQVYTTCGCGNYYIMIHTKEITTEETESYLAYKKLIESGAKNGDTVILKLTDGIEHEGILEMSGTEEGSERIGLAVKVAK